MITKGTIIIVTYCSSGEIEDCLDSIKPLYDNYGINVILVDNASTDGTPDIVKAKYPWIKLICSNFNGGFAYGNNLGLNQADGDWILFLNPDTRIVAGAVEMLVECIYKYPDAGCVGPQIISPDKSIEMTIFPFQSPMIACLNALGLFHILPLNRYNDKWCLLKYPPKHPGSVDRLLGAALVIRAEALKSIGIFDDKFFLYSEEEDICRRLRNKSWKTYYCPDSKVIHIGGASSRFNSPLAIASANWSRYLLVRKHYGNFNGNLVRWIWAMTLIFRFALMFCQFWNKYRSTLLHGYRLSIYSLVDISYFERELRPVNRPISNNR